MHNKFLNENLINIYSFCVLAILFFILSWTVYDNYHRYEKHTLDVSNAAVSNTKDAVLVEIETKKRILDSFVENNKSRIVDLIDDPENPDSFSYLFKKLKKQLPELFSINIYKPSTGLVVDDFEGVVGDLCIADLKKAIKEGVHVKHTHPSHLVYHYDEISKFKHNGTSYIYFASFSLDAIARAIRQSTPSGHRILLIDENTNNLMEVSSVGGRNKMPFREDFRLKAAEMDSIISRADIKDTYWTVVDMIEVEKHHQYLLSLIFPAFSLLIVFSVIVFAMKILLMRNFKRLSELNEKLVVSSKKIVELNVELNDLTVTDALTSLYNRRYFDNQFVKEWGRALRDKTDISVMIIDIDYFKKYNDFYGHLDGDECLKKVADILSSCFSRANEFVARYGGEEFVAVISCNEEKAFAIAEMIHKKLSDACLPHTKSDKTIVSVSIGLVSLVPEIGDSGAKALKKADEALYYAKAHGRNHTHVYSDLV